VFIENIEKYILNHYQFPKIKLTIDNDGHGIYDPSQH